MRFRKKFVSITGAVVMVGAAFAAAAATVAPSASAGEMRPMGWASVHHCTSVAGTATRDNSLRLSATLAGCGNGGATTTAGTGTGTLVATLSGKSKSTFMSLNGTFTITWPASEGLNPSTGTLSIAGPDDQGVF